MSFIKDIEKFFDKVFSSTTVEQKILAATGALAPLVETGLAIEDPQAAPVVTAVFKAVQTDLGTFVAIVQTRSLRPAQPKTPRAGAGGSLAVLYALLPASLHEFVGRKWPDARPFTGSRYFGCAPLRSRSLLFLLFRLSPRAAPEPFLVRVYPRDNYPDPGPLFDRLPHPDRGRTLCTKLPGG